MRRQKNLFLVMIVFLALFLPLTGIVTAGVLKKVSIRAYEQEITEGREFYREKEYGKAIESFEQARTRTEAKNSEILVPLANAYLGVGDYDQAARLLEDWYEESGDQQIKDQLMEVFEKIKELKYQKAVERGRLYLEDDEYEKAIRQFQLANQQEPGNIEPVELLVTSYIAKGDTEMADRVCLDAKNQFSKEDISDLEKTVQNAVKSQLYEELLQKAEELYHQESYEECFTTYKKAIDMYPTKLKGYQKAVKAYQSLRKYDEAIELLQHQMKEHQSRELLLLLENCKKLKSSEVVRYHIFEQLYEAFSKDDMDTIVDIVTSKDYKTYIDQDQCVYYSKDSEDAVETVPLQNGMVIDQNGNIYCGSFKDGERSGHGSYFTLADNKRGYNYYTGKWRENLPNGSGIYYTTMSVPYDGTYKEYNVTVAGNYSSGHESGKMERTLYKKGAYFATLTYRCVEGIPQPKNQVLSPIKDWGMELSYLIGDLVTDEDSTHYYYTKHVDDLRWGIEGLNTDKKKD